MIREMILAAGDRVDHHRYGPIVLALVGSLMIGLWSAVLPSSANAQDADCEAIGVTITWTAAGKTASWADVANWSTGQLPNTGDIACVAGAGVRAVVDGPAVVGAIEVAPGPPS